MAACPHARKLASHLISEQFGEVVQKVCDCLLNSGNLLLSEIVRCTGMHFPHVRDCLLVLIQHNCVQAFRIEQEGGFKQNTFYMAILDNILHRMRFPKFLMHINRQFGQEAEELVSGLLQHGRLTLQQLLKRAAECSQSSEIEVEKGVNEAFISLVCSHYIERCALPEPILEPKSKETQPKKKGRSASKARTVTEEERVMSAAAPMEAERFRVPASLGAGNTYVDKDTTEASVGQKRKRDDLDMDAKEVLWRVNYEEFLRSLRHQACEKLVTSRSDSAMSTGTVLAYMLESTRRSERSLKERTSNPLNLTSITEAVQAKVAGGVDMKKIRAALAQMMQDGFVDRAGDAGSHYAINMKKIIETAKQAELEAVVLQRFGRKSCRIFRLLSMKGHLEHKQISDKCLVPTKETWELLYKLVKERYVKLQEVPKSADRNPSRTMYLWRVNLGEVAWTILDDMYHAALNLHCRLAYELKQAEELLSLSKAASRLVLTSTQQAQANKLSNIAKILETSLMKLDDAIMIFHDF